jgi:hypothetical protein
VVSVGLYKAISTERGWRQAAEAKWETRLSGIEPGFEDRESDDLTNAINKLEPAVTNLYTALTTQPKSHLLNEVAGFRKCGGNSFRNVARLLLDKPPKPGSDVCLCDVNVVAGGHGGRTVTHQPGEGETVHARLCGPRPERVTPAIELERLELGISDCILVGVLQRNDVPRIAGARKHERGFLRPRLCLFLAPL